MCHVMFTTVRGVLRWRADRVWELFHVGFLPCLALLREENSVIEKNLRDIFQILRFFHFSSDFRNCHLNRRNIHSFDQVLGSSHIYELLIVKSRTRKTTENDNSEREAHAKLLHVQRAKQPENFNNGARASESVSIELRVSAVCTCTKFLTSAFKMTKTEIESQ